MGKLLKSRSFLSAKSHRSSELLEHYRKILPEGDHNWLPAADIHGKSELLNNDLLNQIIHSIFWKENAPRFFPRVTKRIFDFAFSLVLFTALLPFFIVLAFVIKLTSPGPIFFTQLRVGQFGIPFRIFKFRTMEKNAEFRRPAGNPLTKFPQDPRVTRIGKLLRTHKIDELPQLLNVIMGDMSLVGPRPLPAEESASVSSRFLLRYAMLPGISGLWQTRAPNTRYTKVKLALDAKYCEKQNLLLDLTILLATVKVVVQGEKNSNY